MKNNQRCFNALAKLVVDRGGKLLPGFYNALVWRTNLIRPTAACRVPPELANQNGPMRDANLCTGPNHYAKGPRNG